MATTRRPECSAGDAPLYVALELSAREWELACAPSGGAAPRLRTLRDDARLDLPRELAQARRHFGLAATVTVAAAETPVRACPGPAPRAFGRLTTQPRERDSQQESRPSLRGSSPPAQSRCGTYGIDGYPSVTYI